MLRPCLSCGRLGRATRCVACARVHKPSPSRRGYGRAHQAARRELAAMLPARCGYGCGAWVGMAQGDWVAAHVIDGDPDAGWLASCLSCNQRAKVRA